MVPYSKTEGDTCRSEEGSHHERPVGAEDIWLETLTLLLAADVYVSPARKLRRDSSVVDVRYSSDTIHRGSVRFVRGWASHSA